MVSGFWFLVSGSLGGRGISFCGQFSGQGGVLILNLIFSMAEDQGQSIQPTSDAKMALFNKQMVKDLDGMMLNGAYWTHAINAVNHSHLGEMGVLGNEPANRWVTKTPYPLVGAIPLTGDQWVLFSTDDVGSEIGVFDDSEGAYRTIVNASSLSFKRTHLITGAAKRNYDCTYSVYWSDGLNPDRMLNLDKVPYKEKVKSKKSKKAACAVPEYTNELDVEALRLSRLVKSPSLALRKATAGGNLLNGSYQAVIAYAINRVRVSDYFPPSNVQSLFDHRNLSGALELEIVECDTHFEEFELVVISSVNQQTSARRLGLYSTRQKTILIDQIKESLTAVPLDWIPLQTPAYDRSDAIYPVNDFLLRTGVYTKPDFNWQPLVDKITTKWVAVEVPASYYVKGGNMVGYLRDEVYAFFIRAVYNTGERSACYPIPGRKGEGSELSIASGQDVFEMQVKELKPDQPLKRWQVENTAKITSNQSYSIDAGKVIAEGTMGYYESTEIYPDNKPQIWGDNCGLPIRHHRMPDNDLVPLHTQEGRKIVVLGVRFENIRHPVDNAGNPITSVVGYEILRASREGNRSIVAKGLLNNMGEYDLPTELSDKKGLYPNFPYNDVRPNPFLSTDPVKGGCQGKGYKPLTKFRNDVFTFHSPETQFRNPFLSATELKIHGIVSGTVTGQFDPVYKHPQHKLIRDFALIISGLVGVGIGLLAIKGKRSTHREGPRGINVGITGAGATEITTVPVGGGLLQGYYAGKGLINFLKSSGIEAADIGGFLDSLGKTSDPSYAMGSVPGMIGGSISTSSENSAVSELPLPLRLAGGAFLFTYFFSQGTEEALRVIRNLIPYQQYGYQYNSHGFYNQFTKVNSGNRRRYINDSVYLEPYLQEFAGKYRVNNLYRSRQVLLETHRDLDFASVSDDSRTTIGELRQWDDPSKAFTRTTSAFYASLKVPLHAQYGQLESCVLLPVSTQVHTLRQDGGTESPLGAGDSPGKDAVFASPVLFGGDVYINRYTEKNSFPLFHEWMHDLPDGTEWDYTQYSMLPYPRYWVNTTQYEITNLTSSLIRFNFKDNVLPNDFAHLDRQSSDCKRKVSFVINKAFFYLFVNGVRDFFVESEFNIAYRDWDDRDDQRHYDPYGYTDLKTLFRSDIIKAGNHFKYDLSLSASRLMHNFISWGQLLPRDFDPLVSERCYQYYPRRVIYSLPQQEELKKDNWTAFLANNYKDFGSRVTAIHSVGQNGAMIFFADRSPVAFQGVDQLQTEAGVKITIGDGGLFQQPLSALTNADPNYEYGACNNRSSIINTPAGLFWISQEQGKVFLYGGSGGLQPISEQGMKFWFNRFLPSQLLKSFPQFQLTDNPLVGIGCMSVYDSNEDVVYFIKRDFKVRDDYKKRLIYDKDNVFLLNGRTKVYLGDPVYFEDASWTVSYDVRSNAWISFHDWKPNAVLPSRSHFLTVKGNDIWKHNDRCDLFCNFYGTDFPFDVEFPFSTGQEVTTLRNLEYLLECYIYEPDCSGRHHVLDFNFDRAMIFNSEQHSGMLLLQPKPKNHPYALLDTPAMNVNGVDTYFAKEENKYRINQFFDLTRNRSEFNDQYIPMWEQAPDGYHRQVNSRYITYSKHPLQRKKFRHYVSWALLRRVKCGQVKMLLKVVGAKVIRSMR